MPKISALPDGSALTLTGAELFPFVQSGATYRGTTAQLGRVRLSADTTYYLRATGSDANDGLTSGTPFATVAPLARLDTVGYALTIQLVGSFTSGLVINKPWVGGGTVTLLGDLTTPSNNTISNAAGDALTVGSFGGPICYLAIAGIKLVGSTNGVRILDGSSCINTGLIELGACSTRINVSGQSRFTLGGNMLMSGNAAVAISLNQNAIWRRTAGQISFTGSPSHSTAFIQQLRKSTSTWVAGEFAANTCTGPRYIANDSTIDTGGQGASFFPGDSAGSTPNNGIYL